MKKIMLVMMMCLMLVGCGKQTALDITKENYEKYGYNYAYNQLQEIKDEYEWEDVEESYNFLSVAEFGQTMDEMIDEKTGN